MHAGYRDSDKPVVNLKLNINRIRCTRLITGIHCNDGSVQVGKTLISKLHGSETRMRISYIRLQLNAATPKTIIGWIIILITDGGQTRPAGMCCWLAYDSKYIQDACARNTWYRGGCVVHGTKLARILDTLL